MAPERPIYVDNHATTRIDPRVLEAMRPWLEEDYGNAASHTHVFGWRAEEAVEQAREAVAAALGAEPREIVFTSGATESNNLALFGVAEREPDARIGVVTVATEHPAVLDPCRALARRGHKVTVLPVDGDGLLDPGDVERALTPDTRLVSVMAANNEIGVLQPVAENGALCRERGVLFHTDAAQAFTKVPLEAGWADLVSLSGHKIHGPKGVGALRVRARPRVRLEPRQHGGGHERGLRSGTVPVALVVGLGKAAEIGVAGREAEGRRLAALRDRLLERLRAGVPDAVVNGHATRRLPNNLSVALPGVDADALLLEMPDVALSTGSACSSASPGPSHVLEALGLSAERVRSSVRIGLGRFNTAEEVDRVADRLVAAVRRARAADPRRPGPRTPEDGA